MVGRKPEPVLIVGLGNLLRRDDGVGCRIAERLQQCPLPPNVRVVDGGPGGLALLELIQGYSRVYLIDAMAARLEPGTIVRRRLSELRFKSLSTELDPHDCRVAGVFRLAAALGEHYDPIIYGVQHRDVSYGMALSDPVQQAAERLIRLLLDELSTQSDPVLDEGDLNHD